jgi:hypothetical protein
MNRRNVLARLGVLVAWPFLLPLMRNGKPQIVAAPRDDEIFLEKLSWAARQNLAPRPLGEIIGAVGLSFLATPYVAHSLEEPGEEHLVVNLRAFDCLTFVESTIALSRCVKIGRSGYEDFTGELQRMRYRNGVINGYASRLHYFSDWILDNEKKGLVQNITKELGGRATQKTLNFMSTHPDSYQQLADASVLAEIEEAEKRLSKEPQWQIPRRGVQKALKGIRDGDVIALATSIQGIDVSHTGLAVASNGVLRYLHAPLSGGAVQLSSGSLADYVERGASSLTGIVVVRPLEKSGL